VAEPEEEQARLRGMLVVELKAVCKELSLPVSGRKEDLVQRILQARPAAVPSVAAATAPLPLPLPLREPPNPVSSPSPLAAAIPPAAAAATGSPARPLLTPREALLGGGGGGGGAGEKRPVKYLSTRGNPKALWRRLDQAVAGPPPADGGLWAPSHLPYAAPLLPRWAGLPFSALVAEVGGLFMAQEVTSFID
jgi:hypothetical protein